MLSFNALILLKRLNAFDSSNSSVNGINVHRLFSEHLKLSISSLAFIFKPIHITLEELIKKNCVFLGSGIAKNTRDVVFVTSKGKLYSKHVLSATKNAFVKYVLLPISISIFALIMALLNYGTI